MPAVKDLKIKIFADGADREEMLRWSHNPLIAGFTTNPTLMRRAGISNYRAFARELLEAIPDRPISFEVLADEFTEMERQALEIAGWGECVYVKIPVTNTRGESSCPLVQRLCLSGVKVNVTALLTLRQVRQVGSAIAGGGPCLVSVFAGRIADTGRDPTPVMAAAVELLRPYANAELLWASPRELLNVFQADAVGCHVITVTCELLKKLSGVGRDLDEYSLETVSGLYEDGRRWAMEW